MGKCIFTKQFQYILGSSSPRRLGSNNEIETSLTQVESIKLYQVNLTGPNYFVIEDYWEFTYQNRKTINIYIYIYLNYVEPHHCRALWSLDPLLGNKAWIHDPTC